MTVKARFWPGPSGEIPQNLFSLRSAAGGGMGHLAQNIQIRNYKAHLPKNINANPEPPRREVFSFACLVLSA